MNLIKIDQSAWAEGIEKLKKSYVLFGPVKDGQFYNFDRLGQDTLPDFSAQNTRMSPKSIVYPQSEVMFTYSLDEHEADHHIIKEAPKDYSPRAVLGIRPCDADAFQLVKRNFVSPDYQDPLWLKAYEATTLIGLACSAPCQSCFCTTAGSGPFHEDGLDLLLVEAGDHFLAKAVTEKGTACLTVAGWNLEIETDQLAILKKTAEERIVSSVSTDRLKDQQTTDLFDAPFWEETAFACINCGTCTYVCPTCWCFDIQDEVQGLHGIRMRNWDSCMFPLFTFHGSGHNPRSDKTQRVRQRFMHKLKYYVDKYDNGIQCVGCGRCIRYCPVNIDIRKVCGLMNSYDPSRSDG